MPKLQRATFELIARTIAELDLKASDREHVAWRMAESLRCTNANFDGERFLKACGVVL